jgi:hypothetical protein
MPRSPFAARIFAFALPALAVACGGGGGGGSVPAVNLVIPFDAANFSGHAIDNPLFPLVPGTTFTYEGTTEDGFEHVETAVTSTTKTIFGVVCVEVHDQEWLDGTLAEDTLDWYAQDDDGNVWYFGEDTKEIEGGVPISTEGSWQAGVDGALPGVVMLASPTVGSIYAQEQAPGVAEDRAEVVALAEPVSVPYGTYDSCLHNREFSPLEPDVREDKYYAPGVGLVLEVEEGHRIELVSVD